MKNKTVAIIKLILIPLLLIATFLLVSWLERPEYKELAYKFSHFVKPFAAWLAIEIALSFRGIFPIEQSFGEGKDEVQKAPFAIDLIVLIFATILIVIYVIMKSL